MSQAPALSLALKLAEHSVSCLLREMTLEGRGSPKQHVSL